MNNEPYSQELIESLRRFEILKNHCLAGSFTVEEFDDRLSVAYGKMTQKEFDIKWGYYKKEQLKCMELYKQMLNI